jgi:hypothetical protein
VPFLRFSRDKRGTEITYVMHTYRSPQGNGATRVLYLFRSPAHVTVGRRPLDDEARAGLEHTHPDLSFDWQALTREMGAQRPAPSPAPRAVPPRETRPVVKPPIPSLPDDPSVLAAVLGVAEAARLRSGYRDLAERVSRRSRSPEEREQLMARLERLNPDGWADAAAVRAGVSTVEAEWDAVRGALPARRRGRRGGRRVEAGSGAPFGRPSGIIAEGGDTDEREEDSHVARPDRDAGDPGDVDRIGGPGAGDGLPGDD